MSDEPMQELEIPDGIAGADQAVEVLRAWIADGALHVIFDPESFGAEVSEWGRLLADVGQHVARAVALTGHMTHDEALEQIRQGFVRGAQVPTESRTGRIRGRTSH